MSFPLIAVDVGNSRIKLGLFEQAASVGLPEPVLALTLGSDWRSDELMKWLPGGGTLNWRIASVQRSTAARLMEWLSSQPDQRARLLSHTDLPLEINVEQPDLVGVDRLVNAVAANRLREPDRPAIVIDVGSAITVDLVSATGVFLGGSIAPGIAMAARALHQFTDLLPLVPMSELAEPPPALGRSTTAAMRSGLYWGAVGAMRELIARLGQQVANPQVFLTGGAAPAVARLLDDDQQGQARYVPHLTLGGIALTALGESP